MILENFGGQRKSASNSLLQLLDLIVGLKTSKKGSLDLQASNANLFFSTTKIPSFTTVGYPEKERKVDEHQRLL